MNTIQPELIEKALSLTGKKLEDMFCIDACLYNGTPLKLFNIEKFCYYILSESFIEKYRINISIAMKKQELVYISGYAIYEFQVGNSQPLIDLLNKI